jgi:hypothetical protein
MGYIAAVRRLEEDVEPFYLLDLRADGARRLHEMRPFLLRGHRTLPAKALADLPRSLVHKPGRYTPCLPMEVPRQARVDPRQYQG